VDIVGTLRAAATGVAVALVYSGLVAWLALQAQGAAVGARVAFDTTPLITGDPVVPWWHHLLTALLTVVLLAAAVQRSRQTRTSSSLPQQDDESRGAEPSPRARRRNTADLWAATAVLVTVVVVGVATIAPLEPSGIGTSELRPLLLVYVQLAALSPALHVAALGVLGLSLATVVARRSSQVSAA